MKSFISKERIEFGVAIWHRIRGNALRRNAGYLVVAAIAAQSNVVQYMVAAGSALSGAKIVIPETPAWISAIFVVLAAVLLVVDRVRPETPTKSKLHEPEIEVTYPFEANSAGKESLFKRSWTPLSGGVRLRQLSIHRFYICVQNPSSSKTLRNVRVVVGSLDRPGPGQVLNLSCLCDRTGKDTADIPPKGHDYFLIGEGVDEADDGMFRPRFMPKNEYDDFVAKLDSQKHIGFTLRGSDGQGVSLLRNNRNLLDVTAYADDVPPTTATLRIDAKARIDLYLSTPISDPMVSIQDAAYAALEIVEGKDFLDKLVQTSAPASPSDRMVYFVYDFLLHRYEMYGTKWPSDASNKIPEEELGRLKAVPRQNRLVLEVSKKDRVIYEDVKMKRRDLERYLQRLRADSTVP